MTPGDSLKEMNKDAKAAIHMAFDELGGVQRLVNWANDPDHPGNLTQFYTQIWPKIIPRDIKTEVSGKDGGPIVITWMGAAPKLPDTIVTNPVDDAVLLTGVEDTDD